MHSFISAHIGFWATLV